MSDEFEKCLVCENTVDECDCTQGDLDLFRKGRESRKPKIVASSQLKLTFVLPEGFTDDLEVRNIYVINELLKDMDESQIERVLDFFKAKYSN